MGDIRIAISKLDEPAKSIGEILLDYYETMKMLEHDPQKAGKQATKIVMTINDVEKLINKNP